MLEITVDSGPAEVVAPRTFAPGYVVTSLHEGLEERPSEQHTASGVVMADRGGDRVKI